ncbi:YihY family inner membrane protein [Kushneria aurantia]|uniref:UPF0761 membrane protein ACFFHW_10380 n=1 Tax=Kushneria aurantia TaxID=504092 RepID=A0ABV6G498_9GAMM|nr:YihY family inner membrane protein [Kushneria aurantia]
MRSFKNYINKLKTIPLAQRAHSGSVVRLVTLFKRFRQHAGLQTAAALTYTTLFAVVPLTTVSWALFSAIPEFQPAGDSIQEFVFRQFVPETGQVVLDALRGFGQQARGLTIVGVVFLLITSIMMMITVETALNRIWEARHNRRGLRSFLTWWAVLTLGPLLIGSGFILSSWLTSLTLLSDAAAWLGAGDLLLHFLPPLLSFVAFLLVFIAVPNARVRLSHAAAGAALVSVALELAKWGFSIFVANFPSYQVIYGAFAAVPLFLLWIFLSWAIILLGAELTALLGESERADWRRWPPFWQTIGILHLLDRTWRSGSGAVPAADIRRRLGGHYHRLLEPLVEAGWVAISEEDEWLLAASLEHLDLDRLIDILPWPPQAEQAPPAYRAFAEHIEEANQQYRQSLKTPLGALLVASES